MTEPHEPIEAVARAIARATIEAAEPDKVGRLSDAGIDAMVENLAVKFYPEARAAIEAQSDTIQTLREALEKIADNPGGCEDEWRNILSENEHMARIARQALTGVKP